MDNEQEKIGEEPKIEKDSKVKKNDLKSVANKAVKRKIQPWWMWPVKILVITLFLSLSFSVLSEVLLSNVGIAVSVVVIVFLLVVGIISDMIGVATTACSLEPFTAMCSRKVRGARVAMGLVKNAEKVSSICNDVVGDICGILSGAAGASITVKFISENMTNSIQILGFSAYLLFFNGLGYYIIASSACQQRNLLSFLSCNRRLHMPVFPRNSMNFPLQPAFY